MLAGRARRPGHVGAGRAGQRDRAGHPVGAVLGYLDRGFASPCRSARARASSPSKARLSAPDGQSRTARTISSSRPPLGATKGSYRAEHGAEPVSAQAGVLADAAVIEDRDLLTRIGIPLVRHPVRVLGAGKAVAGVRPVAERLHRRAAAPAQGQLRRQGQPLPERRPHGADVGDQVGARGDLDRRREGGLELLQGGDPRARSPRGAWRTTRSCSAATASSRPDGAVAARRARSVVAATAVPARMRGPARFRIVRFRNFRCRSFRFGSFRSWMVRLRLGGGARCSPGGPSVGRRLVGGRMT